MGRMQARFGASVLPQSPKQMIFLSEPGILDLQNKDERIIMRKWENVCKGHFGNSETLVKSG